MAKRVSNPKIRAIVMQCTLVGVFLATVGLAALVTRHVRASMRVEMAEAKIVGRLSVRLPAKWLSSPLPVEKGDGIEAEEPPSEQQAGRRLRVVRQRTGGLVSPLEHLARSGQIKLDVLKALAEGREGFSIRNLKVAGWPGQVVTMTASPRPGVVHKDVVACATLAGAEAIVVGLEGLGPPDASDGELVEQVSEAVSLAAAGPAPSVVWDARPGAAITLVDEITVAAPPHYLEVRGADPGELQKQLVFDGSRDGGGGAGAWVAIDLASCVFFADDREETLLAMLAARDPDWRGGPVKRLGPRTWTVDRAGESSVGGSAGVRDGGGGPAFPSRAYLSANPDGRALLVVMRGGPRDGRMFDAAWQSIAASVRFAGTKDLSSLLANGSEAARRVAGELADLVREDEGKQDWYLWDERANAGQELWSNLTWRAARRGDGGGGVGGGWESVAGQRWAEAARPYPADARFEQQWSAAADLSTYQVTTSREVARGGGQRPRQRFEQRVSVDKGRMTLAVDVGTSLPDAAVPPQYVPGAVVPLVMRALGERPALIRTESFVGTQTVAAGGLLTLFVTRLADAQPRLDDAGEPMECVTVSVNGTGTVSRWYYSTADEGTGRPHELRFVDFPGDLRAAVGR